MRRLIFFLIIFISSLAHADSLPEWTKKVQEIELSNGLRFLLYQRDEVPIFSAYMRFRVGGIEEEPGKSGLAHFLEHMAFKGTQTIGTTDYEKEKPILDEIEKVGEALSREYAKGNDQSPEKIKELREKLRSLHQEEERYIVKEDFSRRMMENGGTNLNATTSKDMTSYFVSLPSDKFRFWAEAESRRIFNPVFREFYEEKDVVLEERRMRVDNDPDGKLYESFLMNAFQVGPYRSPTIGLVNDLLRLTRRDLEKFWKAYYRPKRAIGVLAGKLDDREVKKVLEETFGKIRFEQGEDQGGGLDLSKIPQDPPQAEERRITLPIASRPRFLIGYHKPTQPTDDDYIFDLLEQILGDGRTSRLYKTLVLEKRVASQVGTATGVPGSRLPNLFLVEVMPLPGHSTDEIVKLIDDEIQKIQTEGVTPAEIEKARNKLTVDLMWRMRTNNGVASQLSYYEISAGTWKYLATYPDRIQRFGPQDIRNVARQYLVKTNRTIAEIL